MIDLKSLNSALEQLEEDRGISKDEIIGAVEDSLTAAYKKDYGKKGQIIKAELDLHTGKTEFYQVKIVVDETLVRKPDEEDANPPVGGEEEEGSPTEGGGENSPDGEDERPRFNEEHHIWLEDAKRIKSGVQLNEEIVFPLETRDDFGRIAAQTAKQVIMQRVREAEKGSILGEFSDKEGEVISGKVQKIERGGVFVDIGRTTGFLPYEEQIPGEFYRQGERIKAYLYQVEDTPRGVSLRLSRSHPKFVEKLFEMEVPEIINGLVEVKSIAREAGARSKVAVISHDQNIDPLGSLVGQRGARVTTVINELGGEKIDIIEWSEDPAELISNSLSPAKIMDIKLDEDEKEAKVEVAPDQFSLAIGKGGQNVRLAAKLTGWKIDILSPEMDDMKAKEVAEKELENESSEKNSETDANEEAENKDENKTAEAEEESENTSTEKQEEAQSTEPAETEGESEEEKTKE